MAHAAELLQQRQIHASRLDTTDGAVCLASDCTEGDAGCRGGAGNMPMPTQVEDLLSHHYLDIPH